MDDITRELCAMIDEEAGSRIPRKVRDLSWMTLKQLKEDFNKVEEEVNKLEPEFWRSKWYCDQYPLGRPQEHKLFWHFYLNMIHKRSVQRVIKEEQRKKEEMKIKKSLEYYFEDVSLTQIKVFKGIGTRYVNYEGEEFIIRRIEKGDEKGDPVAVPQGMLDDCRKYELTECYRIVKELGKRHIGNYAQNDFYYTLYFYDKHKELHNELREKLKDYFVMGDASGVHSNSIDLYPSKYSINKVTQGDLNKWDYDPAVVWVFMYVSNFVDPDTWEKIEKLPRVLVIDLVPPVFKGWDVYRGGYSKNGLDIILNGYEVKIIQDPQYTRNILEGVDNLVFFSLGSGQQFVMSSFKERKCYNIDERLENYMKREGYPYRVVDSSKMSGFHIVLEDMKMWEVYKKGYFVPLGLINPKVMTIRNPLKVYSLKHIYHIERGRENRFLKEISVGQTFTSSYGNHYFYFLRAIDGDVVVGNYEIYQREMEVVRVNNYLQVYTGSTRVEHLSILDEQKFKKRLKWIEENYQHGTYVKIKEMIRVINLVELEGWID